LIERLCRRHRGGIERAAMPTRVGTLCGQDVDTAGDRGLALGQRGDRRDGGDTEFPQSRADRGVGQPERERHHLRTHVHHQFQLRRPLVVVIAGLAEFGVVPTRLVLQGGRVAVDRLAGRDTRLRYEEVHPEWPRRQRTRCRDTLGERVHGEISAGQEAETTRVGRGRGEFGRAGAAGHRRGDHRDRQRSQVENIVGHAAHLATLSPSGEWWFTGLT
jgi:hypothetical protein